MSGYAASARIVRAEPRLARSRQSDEFTDRLPPNATIETLELAAAEPAEPADPRPTLAERRSAVRERWAQLTFFLLDAESWRT